eukprot:231581_1
MVRSNILTGPAPVSRMPCRSLSEKPPYDSHGCSVSCVTLLHSGSAIECCCEDGSVRLFGMSDPGRVAYTKGSPGVGATALSYRVILSSTFNSGTPVTKLCLVAPPNIKPAYLYWQSVRIPELSTVRVVEYVRERASASGSRGKRQLRWVKSKHYTAHTHDIRALCLVPPTAHLPNGLVVSGGVDTQLALVNPAEVDRPWVKLWPWPHRPQVNFSPTHSLALAQLGRTLQIWRLGKVTGKIRGSSSKSKHPSVKHTPHSHLLELTPRTNTRLCCSALSPDAQWLACSDPYACKLWRVDINSNDVSLKKVDVSNVLSPGYSMTFSPDGAYLIIGTFSQTIQIFDLESLTLRHTVSAVDPTSTDKYIPIQDSAVIHSLEVSKDGRWLASCDTENRCHIFDLSTLSHHCSVPVPPTPVVSTGFTSGNSPNLVLILQDNGVMVFDVMGKKIHDWSRKHSRRICKTWLGMSPDQAFGLAFHPGRPDVFFVYSTRWICQVDLTKDLPPPPSQFSAPNFDRKGKRNH